MTFSPTNRHLLLVVNADGRIDLLDTHAPGGPVKTAEIWAGALDAAFSPDGTHLVSGGRDGTVRLWTLDGKAVGAPLEGHGNWVQSVAFSQDGLHIVSGGRDGTVRRWTPDGERPTKPDEAFGRMWTQSAVFQADSQGWVQSVTVSPDGTRIASGGDDGTVHLWTFDGEQVGGPFVGHGKPIHSVAFSPDGSRIASGGNDGIVRLWALDGGLAARLEGHRSVVWSVAFSPTGSRLASGGKDGTLRLWTPDGNQIAMMSHDATVRSVAFSPDDGLVIASGSDALSEDWSRVPAGTRRAGTIRLWTSDGEPAVRPFEGQGSPVFPVAFSPDGSRIATGGAHGTIRLWNLDGKPDTKFIGRHGSNWVFKLTFSPDGHYLATTSDEGTIRLWSVEGIAASEPFGGEDDPVWAVAFSPDGLRIVSGGEAGTIRLWTPDGEAVGRTFKCRSSGVISIAFSPDANLIMAVHDDGNVCVLTIDGNELDKSFQGREPTIWSAAFSPGSVEIALGGLDGAVRLQTLEGKSWGKPFEVKRSAVWGVAFSPDGSRIITAGEDGGISLWTREGRPVVRGYQTSSGPGTLQWLSNGVILVGVGDRVHALTSSLESRGQIFLHQDGWLAISDEGAGAPTDALHAQVAAIGPQGTAIKGAVPPLDPERARQILFDDFTVRERFYRGAVAAALWTKAQYERLGLFQAPFWLAVSWALVGSLVFVTWIIAPRRVALWAMPAVGAQELPRWRGFAVIITLVRFLGASPRALKAWLRIRHGQISKQNFTGRSPVQERERYCDLGYNDLFDDVAKRLSCGSSVRLWIGGEGGSGKSALAFAVVRLSTQGSPSLPVPVLLDEDWKGDLLEHVARLLRVDGEDRGPTGQMARILGATGRLCLLFDSLTERGVDGVEEQVAALVRDHQIRAVVVTSRRPRPPGKIWETFRHVEVQPLSREQVPLYVATYAPEAERAVVEQRLAPLLKSGKTWSPLYLRFAIERAVEGNLERASWAMLVLDYLEGLRIRRINLSHDDMIRACRIAAAEALRHGSTPREIDAQYLRGVLVREGEELPFRSDAGSEPVDPAEVIEMLVSSGVLYRNQTNRQYLQFTYDPVAEQLRSLGAPRSGTRRIHQRKRPSSTSG